MSELLEASRAVLKLWDMGATGEVCRPDYERLRDAVYAEDQRRERTTELDNRYQEYQALGGEMTRAAWERVFRLHMQYINSDRLSPYEGKLLL